MAKAIQISDNRIDIYEESTFLFSVIADAEVIAMRLRTIQLASIITGEWTYSEVEVANVLNRILISYEDSATMIFKEFDVFNTENKEAKSSVDALISMMLMSFTQRKKPEAKFLFKNGIEAPDILFESPEVIGLHYPTVFARNQIKTVGDLVNLTPIDLKYMRGIREGIRCDKIIEQLRSVGLSLSHTKDTICLLKFSKESALYHAGIKTFSDLEEKTEKDILELGSIGKVALEELKTKMAIFGLKLKG